MHGRMSAKVDTASTSSTGSQKVSKFAAKSGFVIPKNKLSGSLVPIFRGDKNVGARDHVSGESKKEVQRKTKWGADLTQDASVRKGRALAYQVLYGFSASPVLVSFRLMLSYFHNSRTPTFYNSFLSSPLDLTT